MTKITKKIIVHASQHAGFSQIRSHIYILHVCEWNVAWSTWVVCNGCEVTCVVYSRGVCRSVGEQLLMGTGGAMGMLQKMKWVLILVYGTVCIGEWPSQR